MRLGIEYPLPLSGRSQPLLHKIETSLLIPTAFFRRHHSHWSWYWMASVPNCAPMFTQEQLCFAWHITDSKAAL